MLISLSLLALLFAACSDDEPEEAVGTAVSGVGGAESQLCSSLSELKIAVDKVGALNATSTVDDAKEARNDVKEALDDVRQSAQGVSEARVSALQTAFQALSGAVDSVPGDQTLGASAAQIATLKTGVQNMLTSLQTETPCR
jgi:hypothetical protein